MPLINLADVSTLFVQTAWLGLYLMALILADGRPHVN